MTKNSGSPSIGYGSSEYAAQAWSELGNVIFLRHLLREAAKKGGFFLVARPLRPSPPPPYFMYHGICQ